MQGYALYLKQLWKAQHDPGREPFFLTVKTAGVVKPAFQLSFPHCTCGTPTEVEAILLWLAPQISCIALGALPVALRPRSRLTWASFALLLCLTQLQFWPEPYAGFQLTTDPMTFPDAMRIPAVAYRAFVQHAWPAALLLLALHLRRHPSLSRTHHITLVALLLFAATKSLIAVAISEGWREFAPVHQFLHQHDTALTAAALLLLTMSAWPISRRQTIAATTIAFAAVVALYLPAASITEAAWVQYSNMHNSALFELHVPPFHQYPAAIIAIATITFVLTSLVLERAWRPLLAAILCLPAALHITAALGEWTHPFALELSPIWLLLLLTAAGLTLFTRWLLTRTSANG